MADLAVTLDLDDDDVDYEALYRAVPVNAAVARRGDVWFAEVPGDKRRQPASSLPREKLYLTV